MMQTMRQPYRLDLTRSFSRDIADAHSAYDFALLAGSGSQVNELFVLSGD
ncbi:MAG: hypothetical protein ABI583_15750 [Betaproteobacteria bacterium]